MAARPRLPWVLLGLVLVGACSPSTEPAASILPSASATPEAAGANLPPGCEPIELRAPAGGRVVLDGTWAEVGTAGELMTWWIQTAGDCVWGAGHVENVHPGRPHEVQSLAGRIGSDFVIIGEILWLGPLPVGAPGNPSRYSPLRMLIEFDDAGEALLREDREPGVSGLRCPDPVGFCPAPLVLQRVN